ncbi:MAG TPA: PepSY-associated TM helix domain-containing protein, partial [Gemmatimonadaceae bacterium]|nr:PepSY-associated TM helix domain-containing protein [Gemmatimonadaceae bacterium]
MPRLSFRRATMVLHRWVGLVAGVLLAVMGLSGSALVFRAEIDRALNPHLLRVEVGESRQSLAAVVAAASATHPGERPRRLRMPPRPDGSIEVWMGSKPDRFVYVDPYTARVLGARRPTEFLTGWLFELHAYLLAGEIGHRTVGVAALVLVGLALSGLVVWWPGRAKVRLAITVARGRGRRRIISDAHRAGGFYVSGLLLLSGLTGASLIFHEQFEAVLDRAFRTPAVPPAPVATSPAALPALPVDRALAAAERVAPGGYVSYLYLPAAPEEPVTVRKRLPGELHPNGKTFVYVDPRDATILGHVNGPTSPAGARAYSALYPLHTGMAGGLAMRMLMVLVGLSPAVLLVTGVLMWRARA